MLKNFFSTAFISMRFLRFTNVRPFLTKVFNVSVAFMMIFTLVFVTIETINPEPALHQESSIVLIVMEEHIYIKVLGLVVP